MNKVLFSSNKNDWTTPLTFFKELDKKYHFVLDPCSDDNNHLCDNYFTIEDNGLVQDWRYGGWVFCNPPFNELDLWCKKCADELIHNDVRTCLLMPARTDTKYFHNYVLPYCDIVFIKGRLYFGNCGNPSPFPSILCFYGGKDFKY